MPAALALFAVLAVAADGPADLVWLEGEAATATAPLAASGWGRTDYLSGRKWLTATGPVPAAGATASWPFTAQAAGRYDVWARVGFAGDFSPFRWRVAGRPWVDVPGDAPPLDLGAVDDATPVGWVKAGSIDLAGGPHTLEFNVPRPAAGPPRFALDAVCLVRGPFHPDGPRKPGGGRTAIDWEAASRGFEFPPPTPGTAPHARRTLELAGTWQAARWDELDPTDRPAPVAELPDDLTARPWRGVRVPGELAEVRPEWAYGHRFLLRTRFTLPTDAGSRSVMLRLPNAAVLASVFVNGRLVGTSAVPHAPFACDLGAAVRPGPNELVVAIKDACYAVADVPWATLRLRPSPRTSRSGLLEAPALTLAGPAFVADVFARPQVAAGRLALDVTVRNTAATPREVEVKPVVRPTEADGRVIGGTPAKAFAPKPVTVPAHGEAVVTFDEPWPTPRLWWPDDPVRYVVETTLAFDGRPADEQTTRFGFREWGTAGTRVTLNGVPWKLTADRRHADPQPGPLARQAVKDWRAGGVSLFRYAGERPWTGQSQADTLAFFDAAGVPILRAGDDDGGSAADRPAQFLARVRAERNSPAVALWELPAGVDPAAVRAIDPTRPILPAVAASALIDRPVIVTHAVSRPPVVVAAVGGGAALADARAVADRRIRSLAENDRWRGAAVTRLDGDGLAVAWQPVCVLVREPGATVPSGRPLTLNLKLVNDTRVGTPITVHWLLRVRGRPQEVRGKRVVKLPPGGSEAFPLTLVMPAGDRLDAELVLSGERDGREVFRDVRPLVLVGP